MKLKIEKLIFEGFGLGHDSDGRAVFVRKSVPGDEVEVNIIKDKKNFKEGIVTQVITPSSKRIIPPCPHFDHCGGCEHQNIAYKNQLKYKDEIFKEVLSRAKIETEALPIISGSDDEFYYRNTIRFFISTDDQGNLIYQMHDFADYNSLVEIKSCLLQSEFANELMAKFKDLFFPLLSKEGLGAVQESTPFTSIRIREGKATGEFMIELFTQNSKSIDKKQLTSFLSQFSQIKSAYLCEAQDQTLRNVRRQLILGSPIIREKIGKFTFQISPDSFFQTNSLGVKTLYDKIKEFAEVKVGDTILDLYCGTGTIGLYLSTLAKKVIGIEINQNAINDATANAKINHISNTEFICADINRWLPKNNNIAMQQYSNLTVIIDPPRAGLDKAVIENLCKLPTENSQLVYVSCNPATFVRDIKEFEKLGMRLKKVQPIDMFPQNHHIECIGLIEKN